MKKINSKFSIRFFFSIITITFLWFIYFLFFIVDDVVNLFQKIVFVFITIMIIRGCIRVFSLHIKIEDEKLQIYGMNLNTVRQGMSRDVGIFSVHDIVTIRVDYIKREGQYDRYLGKGKPVLFIKTKDGECSISLQSFDPKRVEEFIKLNFVFYGGDKLSKV